MVAYFGPGIVQQDYSDFKGLQGSFVNPAPQGWPPLARVDLSFAPAAENVIGQTQGQTHRGGICLLDFTGAQLQFADLQTGLTSEIF